MTRHHPSSFITSIPVSLKPHKYQPGVRLRPVRLRRSCICFVTAGRGKLTAGGRRYELEPGAIAALPPGAVMRLQADERASLHVDWLEFVSVELELEGACGSSAVPAEEASGWGAGLPAIVMEAPPGAAALFQQLPALWTDGGPQAKLRLQSLFYQLLWLLGERAEEQRVPESIRKAIDYLERHYAESVPMGELPRLAGLTPSSFCRAFKKATGMTSGSYVTQLRMNRAKELLTLPSSTLKEIAQSIGYQDELYFSRMFKQSEGVSPTVYMKRNRKRIAVVSGLILQDHLLSLDIVPIAAPSFPNYYMTASGFPSYLQDRLRATMPLNAERSIRSAEVLDLSPDLIIKMDFMKNPNGKQWSQSDNVVFLDEYPSWQDYQRELGARFQKEREADQVIKRLQKAERTARRRLTRAARSGKWAIIRLLPGDCRIYGVSGHALTELFYGCLEFQPDERIQHSCYRGQAFQELLELNPEHILIMWSEPQEVERFLRHPLGAELRAVRENRVHVPDSREWDPWGPLGRAQMLNGMTDYFAGRGLL